MKKGCCIAARRAGRVEMKDKIISEFSRLATKEMSIDDLAFAIHLIATDFERGSDGR